MAPSVRNSTASYRPGTRETSRPATREQSNANDTVVPSRASSLHSRITQPLPSTMTAGKRPTPKTLTYAYLVCGVGREPSQWVKAAAPAQGKIQHMRGAVGQFWLPEILGSSPRLESDNEVARSLHGAMRVSTRINKPVRRLTVAGLFPARCRNLYRSKPTSLRPPFLCATARLLPYSVRHCPSRLVPRRRETRRDYSGIEKEDRAGLQRCRG